jgi:polyhydroxybutyrate depolymerase
VSKQSLMRVGSVILVVVSAAALGACSSGDQSGSTVPTEGTSIKGSETTASTAPQSTTTSVAASTGCDTANPVAPGEVKIDTVSGSDSRWYWRSVPSAYDGTSPVPVVIDFHGYSEGADVHLMMTEMRQRGEIEGFVTVTPHGRGDVVRWDTALDSPDMVFVGDLLDELEATLCVDRRWIFATGLSNGAMMTSAVACVYADRIAAFAPVAGVQDPEGCAPSRPAPLLAIHGTDDGFVSYTGGLGEDALDLPAPDGTGTLRDLVGAESRSGPTVPEIVGKWAERNGCSGDPTERPAEFADDVTMIAHSCPAGAEVELLRVDGGGHAWPGSEFSARIESVVGFTNMTLDADGVIWNFFVHHSLKEVT